MRYTIYNLPISNPKYLKWLKKVGEENIDILEYVSVWQDESNEYSLNDTEEKIQEFLEYLFERFNIDHPANYAAHSMSVSDIVCLYDDNKQRYFFCDNIGWKELDPELLYKNTKKL